MVEEHGLVPAQIAQAERHWHRRQTALRLRETTSHTYKEIGKFLGVTASRVRDMTEHAKLEVRRGIRSPMQRWIDEGNVDNEKVAHFMKRRCNLKHTPRAKSNPHPAVVEYEKYVQKERDWKALEKALRDANGKITELNWSLHRARSEIKDLKERRDKKSKEFDERYMDLVMDYQDLKIYAMKLEEQLGIRHTPPKPLSQRG